MTGVIERLDVIQLVTQAIGYLPKLFAALMILVLFWLLYRLTRPPLSALLERAGLHPALVTLLVRNLYRITVLIFALVMAADQIGVNVGAALAGLGVVGIAVGFAAQDSIANVISGIMIFMDKPFEVAYRAMLRTRAETSCSTDLSVICCGDGRAHHPREVCRAAPGDG